MAARTEALGRAAGNYHVIQGGKWQVAKWEPSKLVAAIPGYWHIAGFRRAFHEGEITQVGPRIHAPSSSAARTVTHEA